LQRGHIDVPVTAVAVDSRDVLGVFGQNLFRRLADLERSAGGRKRCPAWRVRR